MSIEAAIRSILTTDAGVSALVGNHVYPIGIVEGHHGSAIVFQLLGESRDLACDGLTGMNEVFVQLTAWSQAGTAASPGEARTLIDAIVAALWPSGRPYTGSIGGVTIKGVAWQGLRDAPFLADSDAAVRYGKQLDIGLSYTE